MNKYTDKQIEDTLNLIDSTSLNCEKIQPKLKEGTPQFSLTRNRIKALYISKALVTNQEHNYTLYFYIKQTKIKNYSTQKILFHNL